MSEPVILSLGSVNADFQVRTPRELQAGETLIATRFMRLGGGKAANVAFLARRLGYPALLLARVGDDDLREAGAGAVAAPPAWSWTAFRRRPERPLRCR